MTLIRTFLIAAAVSALSAGAAMAGPVTLKANPVNADGRVTLGDSAMGGLKVVLELPAAEG